jgi:hypothetical protein
MTLPKDDRKMFAPMMQGQLLSPEAKILAVLSGYEAGSTPARLAEEFFQARLAVGTKGPLTRRIGELLDELEQAARVERTPDGRYRTTRTRT